jgi:secreted trypsin-like serine protease
MPQHTQRSGTVTSMPNHLLARGRRRGALLALPILAVTALLAAAAPAGASSAQPRIVGGQSVPITSYPFQAALYVQETATFFGLPIGSELAFCGGVVIDPTQILTAAHCVIDEDTGATLPGSDITALVGTATLPSATPTSPAPSTVTVDPNYNANTNDYDIAILTFSSPLYNGSPTPNGTNTVAPIPLITPALAARIANPSTTPAEPVTVSGWGDTQSVAPGVQPPNSQPTQLQAVQVNLIPTSTCASDYSGASGLSVSQPITARMICAGSSQGGKDACFGDSGGPLVADAGSPADPPSDLVLVGTVDFGNGCAQAAYPGVYQSMENSDLYNWVQSQATAAGQKLATAPNPPPGSASTGTSPGGALAALKLVSRRCTATRCTVTVAARSYAAAAAVRGVRATLVATRGRRTTKRSQTVRVVHHRYQVVVRNLRRGSRYSLQLQALAVTGARAASVEKISLKPAG